MDADCLKVRVMNVLREKGIWAGRTYKKVGKKAPLKGQVGSLRLGAKR